MAPAPDTTNGTNLDFTTFSNVINGKLVGASKTRHAINPATKKASWEVPIASPQDVDEAVAAARTAFKTWSKTSVEERKAALNGLAAELEKYTAEFAKLLVIEQGKPVSLHLKSIDAMDSGLT